MSPDKRKRTFCVLLAKGGTIGKNAGSTIVGLNSTMTCELTFYFVWQSLFSKALPYKEDMHLFKSIIKFLWQRSISIFIQAAFHVFQ